MDNKQQPQRMCTWKVLQSVEIGNETKQPGETFDYRYNSYLHAMMKQGKIEIVSCKDNNHR